MPKTPSKEDLLKTYEGKAVQNYIQLDGFKGQEADGVMLPDADGDCRFSLKVSELRNSCPSLAVRVQIHEDTTEEEATRILTKLLAGVPAAYRSWGSFAGGELGTGSFMRHDDELFD